MTDMVPINTECRPLMPGEFLRQKLVEMGLRQARVAKAIGISRPRLNMIIKGRCPISAEIALRIEKVFGISPQVWFGLRAEFELFEERRRISSELQKLSHLSVPNTPQAHAWAL